MTPELVTAAALAQLLVVGWAGPDGPERQASLHHARAAVLAEGPGGVQARLEVDGGAGEAEALVDAWVGASPWAPVHLRVGWVRAPLGLASERSFWDVHLPDRPGAASLAGDLRGPGAVARAALVEGWLEAQVGVVRTDSEDEALAAGRLVLTVGPVKLGAGGTDEYDAAGDVRIAWTGGELSAGHQRGRSRLDRLARGSWIEVAQHVVGPRWSLLARGETLDDDADRSDTGDVRVWTAGLNVGLADGVRAQALWVHREELDRTGVGVIALDDDRLLVTLALEASAD